jgi:glycerophosphoryl diester phosphodiesterase
MLSYKELPRPAIFAHRGSSAYAPENTLIAFNLAIHQECDGIELDVMLSGDKNLVVIHDNDLSRTTGFKGNVSKLPLSVLKELDAGSFFDIEYQNEKIPLLEEVLELFGARTFINIELKNYESIFDNLPELVGGLVKKFNLKNSILFSSFNPVALLKIKRQLPESPIGLLSFPGKSGAWSRGKLAEVLIRYDAIHPEKGDATRLLIDRAHARSKRVHTYTANEPGDLSRLFDLNVDGIFTDDPVTARSLLKSLSPGASIPG